MKKINGLLLGLAIACAQLTVFCAQSDAAIDPAIVATYTSAFDKAELAKWQYIEKYFTADMNTSKFHQKLGRFLSSYASYISVPAAFLASYELMNLYYNYIQQKKEASLRARFGQPTHFTAKIYTKDDENQINTQKDIWYAAHISFYKNSSIIITLISFLVIKNTLQFVGKKLENKASRCNQLLTNFVKDWETNKNQTPTALQPLFQELSQDFAINGKFTKINNKLANQIVERIIAASLVVNSVKEAVSEEVVPVEEVAPVVEKYEAEKWLYIEQRFTPGLNTSKLHQNIGRFLNKYASYLSLPVAASPLLLDYKLRQPTVDHFHPESAAESEASGETCASKRRLDNGVHKGFCIVAPIITYLLTKKIMQSFGKLLENKGGRCNQILIDYVKDWETNKDQTPEALQPLFKDLSQDLASNGKFTKIDNKLAQQIVEQVVATAMIVNAIK